MTMTWQSELVGEIRQRVAQLPAVAGLWLLGSMRDPGSVDRWSDVDLGLVLQAPLQLGELLGADDVVWAIDNSADDQLEVCRVILNDGRRLDLSVADHETLAHKGGHCLVRNDPTGSAGMLVLDAPVPTNADVNQARFIAAQAAVKLGRGDRLIGTHLALEFLRICLVQAMMLRDRDEGRTVHRFGTARDRRADDVLDLIGDLAEPADVAVALRPAADLFDTLHRELDPAYRPDWCGLEAILAHAE